MKTYISYLVIALLMTHTLTAQVKIGDNPQNLNNSSVLELESTSRVLVITRVNDLQMNAIFPLRGALVYNTDHDCLHYYTGTEWVNICEELDNSFTVSTRADHMRPINPNALDNTVVITETPNPDGSINYNFEVGIINGANIAPSAVNGDKIQNGSVGSQDLAPRSVGLTHLQDGGADGDLFQWNGSAWTLINEADINITETDGIIGNEVTNATDGTLQLNGAGTDADPFTLDVAPNGITDAELANNAVTTDKITDANVTLAKLADGTTAGQLMQWDGNNWVLVDDSALDITEDDGIVGNEVVDATVGGSLVRSGGGTDIDPYTLDVNDGGIGTLELADGAVTTDKITDANVTLAKLADGTTAGQLMQWDGTDWTLVDDSSLNITEVDGIIGNEVTGATDTTLELNGTGVVGDPYTLDVATGGIGTNEIADASVTLPKLADGTTTGQLMQWDGTDWTLVESPTVTEGEGITITPSGQEFNVSVTNPVVAMGKINGIDGSSDPGKLINASINYNAANPGVYIVNFDTPRVDDNYLVQLTLLDAPDGSTIKAKNHTQAGFEVEIFDNINTTFANANWYFTVINF